MDRILQQTCFFPLLHCLPTTSQQTLSPQVPSHTLMSDIRPSKTHLQFHVKKTPFWWAVLHFELKKKKATHSFYALELTPVVQKRCTTKSYSVWMCPACVEGEGGRPWECVHKNSSLPGWVPELALHSVVETFPEWGRNPLIILPSSEGHLPNS